MAKLTTFERFLLVHKRTILNTAPSACICEMKERIWVYVDTEIEAVDLAGIVPLFFEGTQVVIRSV